MQIQIREANDTPVMMPALKSLKNPSAALYAPMGFFVYENDQKEVIIEYNQPSVFFDTFVDASGQTGKLFDMKFNPLFIINFQHNAKF